VVESVVKAMILAAGKGTRLGDITRTVPKCLVEAGGKTMLQHTIERLKLYGITDVVINTSHLAESIQAYLGTHMNFGINITLSHEPTLLGTGGGIAEASRYFGNATEIIVHNADVYSDIPLDDLVQTHRETSSLASLVVMERQTSRPLLFNEQYNLVGFESDSHGELFGDTVNVLPLAFSGIQVISPQVLNYFAFQPPFSSITGYLSAARSGERIRGHKVSGNYWIDMGRQDDLNELRTILVPPTDLQ
jgi:NDP-sugar pyrophosphorylase family protein